MFELLPQPIDHSGSRWRAVTSGKTSSIASMFYTCIYHHFVTAKATSDCFSIFFSAKSLLNSRATLPALRQKPSISWTIMVTREMSGSCGILSNTQLLCARAARWAIKTYHRTLLNRSNHLVLLAKVSPPHHRRRLPRSQLVRQSADGRKWKKRIFSRR